MNAGGEAFDPVALNYFQDAFGYPAGFMGMQPNLNYETPE